MSGAQERNYCKVRHGPPRSKKCLVNIAFRRLFVFQWPPRSGTIHELS